MTVPIYSAITIKTRASVWLGLVPPLPRIASHYLLTFWFLLLVQHGSIQHFQNLFPVVIHRLV